MKDDQSHRGRSVSTVIGSIYYQTEENKISLASRLDDVMSHDRRCIGDHYEDVTLYSRSKIAGLSDTQTHSVYIC